MLEALGIQLIQELNPELLREGYQLGWNLNLDLSLREKRNLSKLRNKYQVIKEKESKKY